MAGGESHAPVAGSAEKQEGEVSTAAASGVTAKRVPVQRKAPSEMRRREGEGELG
jgi:hypothetical protein